MRLDSGYKIIIVIPLYQEYENILRFLISCAKQRGVSPDSFELLFIVNNSIEEATRNAEAYIDNQKALTLLRAIISKDTDRFKDTFLAKDIDVIIRSGIRIDPIDCSTADTAFVKCNVGIARDYACRIAIAHFEERGIQNGLLFMTDGDVEFFDDTIQTALLHFEKNPRSVGATGQRQGFYQDDIHDAEGVSLFIEVENYIERIFTLLGYDPRKVYVPRIFQDIKFEGSCSIVKASAYVRAGGIPHVAGAEDYILGYKLAKLGTVDTIPMRIHYPLRVSTRTHELDGTGRYIEKLHKKVSKKNLVTESVALRVHYTALVKELIQSTPFSEVQRKYTCSKNLASAYETALTLARNHDAFVDDPEKIFELRSFLLTRMYPLLEIDFPPTSIRQTTKDLRELAATRGYHFSEPQVDGSLRSAALYLKGLQDFLESHAIEIVTTDAMTEKVRVKQ